jgi:hypothetical protein
LVRYVFHRVKGNAALIGAALVVLALAAPVLVAYGHENDSESAAQNGVPLSKHAGDKAAPTRPTGLLVTAVSRTSAQVSWHPSSDNKRVAGYLVSVDKGAPTRTLRLSLSLRGLDCGTSFQVTTVAYDKAGNKSAPAEAHFATSPCHFNGTVSSPSPPSPYQVPAGARLVSTSAGLMAALQSRRRTGDIVLANGTYDSPYNFRDSSGVSIYAQHLGGAVLTAGLSVGGYGYGSGGVVVQGLAFDVSNPDKAAHGGEIYISGPGGEDASVLDTTFDGNKVVPIGLNATNPDGLIAKRLTFTNFTDEGIRASDNKTVGYGDSTPKINTITDIYVNGVSRSTPGASDGTAEAGIWIGHPVVNGVHRIKIRNVSWSGIETVSNAWNTTFTDLDIDMSGPNADVGVAVYLEHFSQKLVFNGFVFTGARSGFHAEWNDPAWGGVAAAHNTTIENGVISAAGWNRPTPTVGVYLDSGTQSTTIKNVTFKNQTFAGIDAYNTEGTNRFSGNKYQPGITRVSNVHLQG